MRPTRETDERTLRDGGERDQAAGADPLLRLRKQARMRRLQGEFPGGQDLRRPDQPSDHP